MSRKDLANKIWRACDIMRTDDGTTGILEYIEQLSWMIFLKVYDDLETRFEARANVKGDRYERVISEEFRWPTWTGKDWRGQELVEFIDLKLFPHLRALSGTPQRQMIATIFSEIERNRMRSPFNLKDVINTINEIDFNDPDDSHTLSQVYEELLLKLGKEGGVAGEFYTPRPIVKLMVRITNPKVGESILDPFCGSGGFLAESFIHITSSQELTVQDEANIQTHTFFGQEKKPLPYLIGVMNCILHGIVTPQIKRTNTLSENIRHVPDSERFDIILTNPPFGGEETEQVQENFPIKSQATQLLALQYVMRKLRQKGRCAIVLPESTLSTGGVFETVRMELLSSSNLHTIISLPAGVFANVTASGPGPKTNLLFFERGNQTQEIWYYELGEPLGTKYTRSNPITEEDLRECAELARLRAISARSWIVPIKSIVERKYDLTARNPNQKEETVPPSPTEIVARLHQRHIDSKLALDEMQRLLTLMGRGVEIESVSAGRFLSLKRDFFKIDDSTQYQRITVQLHGRGIIARDTVPGSDIKVKKQQRAGAGDLVVAEIDAKVGGFGIVPADLDGAIVSSHYFVYRIDTTQIDPRYLGFYLKTGRPTADIQRFVKGSLNYRSIRPEHFPQLSVPLPSLPNQRLISDLFESFSEMRQLSDQSNAELGQTPNSILHYILGVRSSGADTNQNQRTGGQQSKLL